ncbi:DUF2244 domain-containing protein [Kordiimonas lacus]|uniref:Uncharacterized membrane protein n=1 Tax=Kordiimonas lacus TaxID=637679 RepID=A0A1G6TJ99_9PROT|nr:DUF2244 domain-containing protein [Kordiimonas lacus]SDD29168.1 Uncharacterized membrane protein [Kordiimonas lacus]
MIARGGAGETAARMGDGRKLLFDATLYPHRSLKPHQFRRLFWFLIAVCLLAGLRFIMVGAWPVVIFLGVDLLAIWLAFHFSYRSARLYETLQLSEKDLILTRVHPGGRVESWRFDPYWVKLDLKTIDEDRNQLSLASHGETLVFGAFLTPTDRRKLRAALMPELLRLKG